MNRISSGRHFLGKSRGTQSKSAVILSGAVLIAIVIVIGLLVALSLITLTNSSGITNTVTRTTTAFVTDMVTLDHGNASALGFNPEQIYSSYNQSIVTLEGTQTQSGTFGSQQVQVLGSGFVIDYNNSFYIITNYHVAGPTQNLDVTFNDGDSYAATVVGSDPYSDLAIVTAPSAPAGEYHPMRIASSSSLHVGEYVATIGNPFGLSGSMTFGIISRLGGTIQDPTAGNFSIADVIQFSAPINPGNSGGVLLDSNGSVVGITTATVNGSQGVGFAIPSDTILKELPQLIAKGTYALHSYLGISGSDMTLELAHATGSNVTYGVLVEDVVSGGPAAKAGLKGGASQQTIEGIPYLIGGDIIVSINGTKIVNNDALATYLAENTVAGQVVVLGIIRSGSYMTLNVTLGQRPSL